MNTEQNLQIAFWVLLGLMLTIRIYFAARVSRSGSKLMPDKAAVKREGVGVFAVRFTSFFLIIAMLIIMAFVPSWRQALTFTLPPWLRWAGFALGLLCLPLLVWVELALGRFWSAHLTLREGHKLITSGPYASVRHPMYTVLTGLFAALTLVSGSWMLVFLLVVVVSALASRVSKEEHMLIEQFGDEYRDYIQRTGRFLPKISAK